VTSSDATVSPQAPRRVLLAKPRGYCAGVDRAVQAVELALDRYGPPVYVRRQIVHNTHVVSSLEKRGAIFVTEVEEVPTGAVVVFSAHGIAPEVRVDAERRGLRAIDATCPLVTKVHMEVQRYASEGRDVILIGHAGHPEVEGTMGRFDGSFGGHMHLVESAADVETLTVRDERQLAFVTQTTLSVDDTTQIVAALKARFAELATPRHEDICYATQNRQDAVKKLLDECDVLLVVGSRTSSNSNRLRELADRAGIPGYLIDGPEDLHREWFDGKSAVGLTAGASAPEVMVQQVIQQLRAWGGEVSREIVGREEKVYFSLPRDLRR
jgi:4-hydroxy-3-methylbut-2-en-1-yl diphosphate reductase